MPTLTTIITTDWTPPAIVSGVSGTTVDVGSQITINWDISTLSDTTFSFYRIYRRVAGTDTYRVLVDITDINITEYIDVTASQTVTYEYIVTQFEIIPGDVDLESDHSDIVTALLGNDAWFIIMRDVDEIRAFELNVESEDHHTVLQQEVFEPLISGFKRVVRGGILGDEGSLVAIVDVADTSLYRLHFDRLQFNKGPHLLKSPFGDIWAVEFDAPSYKFMPAGHLEITIGWVEVD